MKRLISFLTICVLLCSIGITCYAGESKPNEEKRRESFGIYATYVGGSREDYPAPVENGSSEVELPDGTVITVSEIPDDIVTLVVYPITAADELAWEWFRSQIAGNAENLFPYEVYFLDGDGNSFSADGVTITITLPDSTENISAFSLNPDGSVKSLELQAENNRFTFRANGSRYYVLAEDWVEVTVTPGVTTTPKPTTSPDITTTPKPTTTPDVTATPEPTITPDITVTPEPTTMPDITVTPGITTMPEPTITPGITTIPEPTTMPDVTTPPEPTTPPDVTTAPEPTAAPDITTMPEPTITPDITAIPEPTITPDITTTPEPTTTPGITMTPEPTITPGLTTSPDITKNPTGSGGTGNTTSQPQTQETSSNPDTPRTGDDSRYERWSLVFWFSGGLVFCLLLLFTRKRNRKHAE